MPGGQGGPEERFDISRAGRPAVPKPVGFGAVMTLPTVQQAAQVFIPSSPSGALVPGKDPLAQGVSLNSKFRFDRREQMEMLDLLRRASTWPPARRP